MAVVPLTDGSYIELIAAADEELLDRNPFWSAQILADAGPCGWCVGVDNVEAESARLEKCGVTVDGPYDGARVRPDGTEVRWRMAFVGESGPGALLPFLIEDVTPRTLRVAPASPPGDPASSVVRRRPQGITAVVLGVPDLAPAVRRFRAVYGWCEPTYEEQSVWGARLAWFSDAPVVLATAVANGSWLAGRTQQWGASPCAYLIEPEEAEEIPPVSLWAGREVAWLDLGTLGEMRLGLTRSAQN